MPNFFIDRPIFAWVIAIIIMLAGGLAILKLPVAQYPTIAPPAVTISASYPGADAKTVQDTVTQRGGTGSAANRPGGGAVFTVRWPAAEGGGTV